MAIADPLPHLLTIEELAEHLGVTVRHVRRQITERRLPYLKVGRLVRFDPDEIVRWLEQARQPQQLDHGRTPERSWQRRSQPGSFYYRTRPAGPEAS